MTRRESTLLANGKVALVLFGFAVFVALVSGRLVLESRRSLAEARGLLHAGDRRRALVELEDAAKAYVPGSPYPRAALKELTILAKSAEMRGEQERALFIWDVIRRSVLATRHFVIPNQVVLEQAERAIARLRNSAGEGVESESAERPPDPQPFLSLLVFLGLLTWAGSALLLCLLPRGFGDEKRSPKRALAWVGCLCGFGLWLAMCWLAG